MNYTLQTTEDIEEAFTTELCKIQQQIITYVKEMQPVCKKVVKMNAGSYAKSTVYENIDKLIEMGKLRTNSNGALIIP